MSIPVRRPAPRAYHPQGLGLDKGYDHDVIRRLARHFKFTLHLLTRGEEIREFSRNLRRRARRWVVERTHSWTNRFRRILIRWEKNDANYIAMLHLTCGIIAWRAAGLMG